MSFAGIREVLRQFEGIRGIRENLWGVLGSFKGVLNAFMN